MAKKQKTTKRKPWDDPDDAPEITDELLDRVWDGAEISEGDRIIRPRRPPFDLQSPARTLKKV
jgi:hypothetical protein